MRAIRYSIVETAWGPFAYVVQEGRLLRTILPGSKAELMAQIRESGASTEDREGLPRFPSQVMKYFKGEPVAFDVELDLAEVPPFRRRILEACRRIPYGRTASYGDLARAAGNAAAVRAAGSAMAHNPLPLVVPCHRVLRGDGSIGGFSSSRGVQQKIRLLQLEGISLPGAWMRHLRRAV